MKRSVGIVICVILSWIITTVDSGMIAYNVALDKKVYQSSVWVNIYQPNEISAPSLANDGSHETPLHACAASMKETNPWWAVDLGRPTIVYKVHFTNMFDKRFIVSAYEHRSDNFIVGLTNVSPRISPPTLYNYTLCGQYPGHVPAGATVSLYCQKHLPPFRYVIVQFPLTNDHMNVCEIEVIELISSYYLRNVALGKTTFQVSTYTDQNGRTHSSSLANDGSQENDFSHCAASNPETNPWWAVDLVYPTVVFQVNLTNRGDNAGNRSDKYIVGLTNDPIHLDANASVLWNYALCGQYPGAVPDGDTVSVQCTNIYNRGLRFRYVIVQFPINGMMNVCEIEVFEIVSQDEQQPVTSSLPSTTSETTLPTDPQSDCSESIIITVAVVGGATIILIVILLILLLKQRIDIDKKLVELKSTQADPGYEQLDLSTRN